MLMREVALPLEQPQLQVILAGGVCPGVISASVETAQYFHAGRFSVRVAFGGFPLLPLAYFTNLGRAAVEIFVAAQGGAFVSLMSGLVDNICFDLGQGVAVVTGRDLTALMIDAEVSETFVNQTASQIAQTIAQRHGFGSAVTPTTELVGQYYQIDHARTVPSLFGRGMSEWTLLTGLAEVEGCQVFLQGDVLYFGPAAAGGFVVVDRTMFMSLAVDMASALPAAVNVKSWNSLEKSVVTASQGQSRGVTIVRPNLTQSQAAALAQQQWAMMRGQAFVLRGVMPADLTTQPGMSLTLVNTGSGLDQNYTVMAVARALDGRDGFVQTVTALAEG